MKKSLGPKPLAYPTPVFVVGTYDKAGRPNVMTAAWAGICCSSPPCISVSLRRATSTHGNIMEHRAFTISIPSQDYVREVDYFGMVSGEKEDKFSATGLTPVRGERVNAPYVKEFAFILECKLLQTLEIGLHTQFIGEILDIKAEEAVLGENGLPHIEKVRPLLYAPEYRMYYGVGEFVGKAYSIGKGLRAEGER
jgi:flavin reductase (DIM6/NTAB) family NADH-FMN oxidoreductase RutF